MSRVTTNVIENFSFTLIKSEKISDSRRLRHGGIQFAFFRAWWELKRRGKTAIQKVRQSGHFAACLGGTARRSCPGVLPSVAESPPQAGSADMLPKVETESLGLSRSYGEQGLMPRNMQGKNCHVFQFHSEKPRRRLSGLRRCRTEVHGAHRGATKTFERADVTFLQIK